jgi:hypothetical protein
MDRLSVLSRPSPPSLPYHASLASSALRTYSVRIDGGGWGGVGLDWRGRERREEEGGLFNLASNCVPFRVALLKIYQSLFISLFVICCLLIVPEASVFVCECI